MEEDVQKFGVLQPNWEARKNLNVKIIQKLLRPNPP